MVMAAQNNHPEMGKMLTDKGADLNAKNQVGYYYTCIKTNSSES